MQTMVRALSKGELTDPAMISQLPQELQERYVIGHGFTTKEAKPKADEKISTITAAQNDLGELINLAEKGSKLSTDDIDRAAVLAIKLKAGLRSEIVGPGAATDTEYKMLDTIISDPMSFKGLAGRAKIRLETTKRKLGDNLNIWSRQNNLQPLKQLDLKPVGT